MKVVVSLVLCALVSVTAGATLNIDMVTVGNPGNPGDVRLYGTFGSVAYSYRIGKYEVTNSQYAEFLNAVDPIGANLLALYNPAMSSSPLGGINFNGIAAAGARYEVKNGRDDNPVVFVSFFDAARFVNWLQNGQGNGSTESGVYVITESVIAARNPNATYFIPSENEWYKAAYHKNDGATSNYWDYPTSTDSEPYSDNPVNLDAPNHTNVSNFFKTDSTANGYDGGYAVTGVESFSDTQHYLTNVGAYAQAVSPYGTFDQGGNVWEWNEAILGPVGYGGVLGGDWSNGSIGMHAASRGFGIVPSFEYYSVGFRVASIPEPNSLVLGGLAAPLIRHRRRLKAIKKRKEKGTFYFFLMSAVVANSFLACPAPPLHPPIGFAADQP